MNVPLTRLREATHSDNQKILALSRRCPMHGAISLYTDRSPDFFHLYRMVSPENHAVFVYEKADEIVGSIGIVIQELIVDGETQKVGFVGDLKVDPDFRKSIIAHRLVDRAVHVCRERGCRMFLASIVAGNEASLTFTNGRGRIPKPIAIGDYIVKNIPPLRRLAVDPDWEVAAATLPDAREMVHLYNEYYSSLNFAPRWSEQTFLDLVNRCEGLSLSDFLLLRHNGHLAAVCAIWNQKSFQRYVVQKFDRTSRIIMQGIKAISWIVPLPPVPHIGRVLHNSHIAFAAVKNHDHTALDQLLRTVNNRLVGTNTSFFSAYFSAEDTLCKVLGRFFGSTTRLHLYAYPLTPWPTTNLEESLRRSRPFAEYATFI